MRKIVPVAARISSGKSTLLNTLYNIDFLECKANITTKFINLLRYNPNIHQPIFYHLKLKKEGDEYIFYKDLSEKYEGEKEIIEANKDINKKLLNEKEVEYEDIFYMTEINRKSFIKDKNYLLTHDLCDMPGLSEYQNSPTKNIKEKENNAYYDDITDINEFNLIDANEDEFEDEIYNKTKNKINNNTYLKEIFEIIKNYIDGGIIIFNLENFEFSENFELIARLHKIIKKDIINFLIILNKIDLSKDPKKDIEMFKGEIIKQFPKYQTFNINLNTFIPLSAHKVQNELLMEKSFRHLMLYHFYNFKERIEKSGSKSNNKSFINHLIDIIKTNDEINCKVIEKEVSKINNSDNTQEIKTIIKDLEFMTKGTEIKLGVSEKDFNDNDDDDDDDDEEEDENSNKKDNNNLNKMKPSYIIKLFYSYHKQKKFIPFLSEETNNLLDYFRIKQKDINFNKRVYEREINERTTLNNKMKEKLTLLMDKLKNSKFELDKIKNLRESINYTLEFLTISDNIFIPFLGASNSGKTTILNGIIGRNILPTNLNECTKRGIIIRYCDSGEEETTIRKVNFEEDKFYTNKNNFFLKLGYIIGKGDKKVSEILSDLNYDYTDKEEDCFYYIRTKIKLFDEIGMDESLKTMIYLIDFPGYGTNSKFMEQKTCKNIIANSSSFIFTIKNSIIKENTTKQILDSMFQQAKILKLKIYSGIIKSCLFILNYENSKTTAENDLDAAKKDISEIINVDELNDINLCFYNAKFYSKYCEYYNYCFNLKETLNMEYSRYLGNRNIIFKNPEDYTRQYDSFFDFLIDQLKSKIKEEFKFPIKIKNQDIDKSVEEELNKIFTEFNQLKYITVEEIKENQTKIAKYFSYMQKIVSQLNILKESNFEDFKKSLKSQINYISSNLKDEFNKKIENIISSLDDLFSIDFTNNYYCIKEIQQFRKIINESKTNIVEISNSNQKRIWNSFYSCENEIKEMMENKKESIDYMDNINVDEILKELSYRVEDKVRELNDEIDIILNDTYNNIYKEWEKVDKEIKKISGDSVVLSKIPNFKEYIKSRLGDKNKSLYQQLYKELDFSRNLFQIYNNQSFFKSLKSTFSKYNYIKDHIDIITKELREKIEYIVKILDINFGKYLRKIILSISKAAELTTINFSKEQLPIWKEIKEYYQTIKIEMQDIKNEICKNVLLE